MKTTILTMAFAALLISLTSASPAIGTEATPASIEVDGITSATPVQPARKDTTRTKKPRKAKQKTHKTHKKTSGRKQS